jgi:hypothetical protein
MPEVLATGVQTCAGSRCLETAGVPASRGAVGITQASATGTQSRNVGGNAQGSITGE